MATESDNGHSTITCLPKVPPKKKNECVIGTINVRSLSDDIKLGTTYDLFRNLRHSVCCLQETRRTGQGILQHEEIQFIWSGHKKKRAAGVGILISNTVKLIDVNYINERILQILVKLNNINIAITNCYAPTNDAKGSQKDTFYRILKKCFDDTPAKYKQIITGDFNATIGEESYGLWRCLGPANNKQPTNDNGQRLLQFTETHKLRLENSVRPSTKGDSKINTWISPKRFEKRLDYVLTNKFTHRYATKCMVRRGSSRGFETDHLLLETSFQFPSVKYLKATTKKRGNQKPKINIQQLTNPKKQNEYINCLESKLSDTPKDDLENENTVIIEAIKNASSTVCDTHNVKGKRKQPWENDELQELIKQQNNTDDESKLKNLKQQVKKKRQSLMNDFYREKADSINQANEARQIEREFAEAKKHHMHQQSRDFLISKETLHKHFQNHFKENDIIMPVELIDPENSCLKDSLNNAIDVDQSEPTGEEIRKVMLKLKNGKCEGTDGIKMEQLKCGASSPKLVNHITSLILLIWTLLAVPAIWLQSRISCIFKGGVRSVASNYRGINVLAVISRLLPMIILNRISEAYNRTIDETQYGFRKNKGCDNAIFVLRNIINTSKDTMYICFIDLTAAYDKIPRKLLFRVLDIRLGCTHIINLIKTIYTETTARITGLKRTFPINAGCRQGGIESPVLFNIYFDTVCRVLHFELKQMLGADYGIEFKYQIPNETTSRSQRSNHPSHGVSQLFRALYADDMFIIFKTKEALQKGMIIVENVFSRYGLTLSRKKTETMLINGDQADTESETLIKLEDKNIKNVKSFKYLGVKIAPADNNIMIQHRISTAIAKFAEMKNMFKNHRISVKIRAKFLNVFIRSRLTYNCATLFNAETQLQKLEVEWTRMLRRIVKGGMTRRDAPPRDISIEQKKQKEWDYAYKYSNADIHRICGTIPLQHFIKIQHLKWIAHVIRMDNQTFEKQTLFMEGSHYPWKKLEDEFGMDRSQIRRIMFCKDNFDGWLAKFCTASSSYA